MKAINNFVLVKPDDNYNKVLSSSGAVLLEYLDTYYEPEHHAVTSGMVVSRPGELRYHAIDPNERNSSAMRYKTELEVDEGDRVIFHYLSIKHAIEDGRVSGDGCYYLRYDNIYLRIRNDVIQPVNGFIIIEPVDEIIQSTLTLPPWLRKKKSVCKGIIRYLGNPIQEYRDFPQYSPDEDDLRVGDTVIFEKFNSVALQYSMHQIVDRGTTLYRMQRRDIICTCKNVAA